MAWTVWESIKDAAAELKSVITGKSHLTDEQRAKLVAAGERYKNTPTPTAQELYKFTENMLSLNLEQAAAQAKAAEEAKVSNASMAGIMVFFVVIALLAGRR
jgi:hypothetical protein